MKVKLLKKVRKRYTIVHYPNGMYQFGKWLEGTFTVLYDKEDSWRWVQEIGSKESAYEILHRRLVKWIKNDYEHTKKRENYTEETLWHK